ncbi:MAG: hypothetical protein IPK60_21075 [Sandaracinaceae bacterium]|nr:hypothetical protein [Sandaracinaceae bacterium]
MKPTAGLALALDGPVRTLLRNGATIDPNDSTDRRPDAKPRNEQRDSGEYDEPQEAAYNAERTTEEI